MSHQSLQFASLSQIHYLFLNFIWIYLSVLGGSFTKERKRTNDMQERGYAAVHGCHELVQQTLTPARANEYNSVHQFALITFFFFFCMALCAFSQNWAFDLTKQCWKLNTVADNKAREGCWEKIADCLNLLLNALLQPVTASFSHILELLNF